MLRKKGEKGFTLIELLIVIATIGILAAIAIPIYRTNTVKAKLTEVTNAMSYVASAVTAYNQETEGSAWPNCTSIDEIMSSLGISLGAVPRISAMSISQTDGRITASLAGIDGSVDGRTLVLSPSIATDGSITWQWDTANSTILPIYIPKR